MMLWSSDMKPTRTSVQAPVALRHCFSIRGNCQMVYCQAFFLSVRRQTRYDGYPVSSVKKPAPARRGRMPVAVILSL